MESRFEFVRSCEADFDQDKEEAEAGESDNHAEDGAVDGSVGREVSWNCYRGALGSKLC